MPVVLGHFCETPNEAVGGHDKRLWFVHLDNNLQILLVHVARMCRDLSLFLSLIPFSERPKPSFRKIRMFVVRTVPLFCRTGCRQTLTMMPNWIRWMLPLNWMLSLNGFWILRRQIFCPWVRFVSGMGAQGAACDCRRLRGEYALASRYGERYQWFLVRVRLNLLITMGWRGACSFTHGRHSGIDLPTSWSDRTAVGSFKMEHLRNISRLR